MTRKEVIDTLEITRAEDRAVAIQTKVKEIEDDAKAGDTVQS